MEHVGRDPAPQQLHRRPPAIMPVHAGPSELQHPPRKAHQRRNVVFARRIEPPDPLRRLPLHQPIGSHHALGPRPDRMVDHQQVVSDWIVQVDVAPRRPRRRIRHRAELLVEHPVAQRLRRIEIVAADRHPHAQMPGPELAKGPLVAHRTRQAAPEMALTHAVRVARLLPGMTDGRLDRRRLDHRHLAAPFGPPAAVSSAAPARRFGAGLAAAARPG